MGQGHEMMNFGNQEVKGQGHTRLKIDLEALEPGIILDSFGTSNFSSFLMTLILQHLWLNRHYLPVKKSLS